jgi:excisionase family DNA binding protein
MANKLLSKKEAREVLRVSRPTLDRMISRGDLPVVRLSQKTVRIAESALSDLVERRTERRAGGDRRA